MDVLVFIPVWRRKRITELCYKGLQRLLQQAPSEINFQTLIVLSEEEHIPLAEKYGHDWCMTANRPVGSKFNAGLEYALREYGFDYLFQLNSDNLIANEFWDHFGDWLVNKKWLGMGVDRIYFYDSSTGDILNFRYFGGCGIRFLARSIIEHTGWRRYVQFKRTRGNKYFYEVAGRKGWIPETRFEEQHHVWVDKLRGFELWPPDADSGLDTVSYDRIQKAVPAAEPLRIPRHSEPLVVDIKGPHNIHPFSEFQTLYNFGDDVDPMVNNRLSRDRVIEQFPELKEIEKMLQL